MIPFLRGGVGAIMVLTRIPVTMRFTQADWNWATAWFPVVGAAIGAFVAATWWAARSLGAWPAVVLAVGAGVLITGALHEDGLADTADALGGSEEPEKIFAILKDSRVGTYGALALMLALFLRVSLLVEIGPGIPAALILSHALGRFAPAVMMSFLPYVTPADAAKSRATARPHPLSPYAATINALAVAALLWAGGWLTLYAAIISIASTGALAVLLSHYFVQRVGGVTGDLLGAAEQVAECGVLVALAATCC